MSGKMDIIDQRIDESIKVKQDFNDELKKGVSDLAEAIIKAHKDKKRVFVFGNGGSASDAAHLEAELVGRFLKEKEPMDVMALNVNTSLMTALINDYPAEEVFSRQVKAHVSEGDVVIGITTSGNSPNVLEAIKVAKEKGATTAGLTGESGGKLAPICDILLNVPSAETPRIQESHVLLIHLMCELVESEVCSD